MHLRKKTKAVFNTKCKLGEEFDSEWTIGDTSDLGGK